MLEFSLPDKITAEYIAILPMFLGDADKKATKISPLSVKGAIRFWWRALVWAKYADRYSDDVAALKALHLEEAQLFGTTVELLEVANSSVKRAGKGMVSIAVEEDNISLSSSLVKDWPSNLNSPSGYVAMGIPASGNDPHREAFKEGKKFTITLHLGKTGIHHISQEQQQDLIHTLKLLGAFGGLGARSRRGFGSVQLQKINDESIQFNSSLELKNYLNTLIAFAKQTRRAPFSAFSKDSQCGVPLSESCLYKDARQSHAKLTSVYKDFRSEIFTNDKNKKRGFGLPLGNDSRRRASPFFFHTSAINDRYLSQLLYLPTSIFHYAITQNPSDESTLVNLLRVWSNQGAEK
ncbi:type III-B CRISPR module RAMP protein Cmr1 [Pelistega sp. MC2]|uniref:type III-B CRISPR module RAMP protein Cmr1 n=1 Tax=Pelistega sp. MC2 TaxID=1720297 RepID=UPI0008D9A096|nr:type III-B CRISPR module RAMP protein Cmr1 [Pelistega sp. MC2]